jgi:hypothetical protein
MHEKTAKQDRFDWRLPLYAAVGALILFVPILIYGDAFLEIAYIILVALIVSFILLIVLSGCRYSQEEAVGSRGLVDVSHLLGRCIALV